jgi:hypothetical protein
MEVAHPTPIGDASAVRLLRSVIFTGIEGAAVVYPKGLTRVQLSGGFGAFGPMVAVHATDPLPATPLFIAVTPEDIRLFGRPRFSTPFEIGRWKKRTYRASILEGVLRFSIVLELETLGRIRLNTRFRAFAGSARQVLDLVVQNASGPAVWQ